MEGKPPGKFTMGRESSMAPERHERSSPEQEFDSSEIESGVRLMYLSNEGDLEGINEALDSGVDVNFKDIDSRTALHVAACQGRPEVVELLLKRGAEVDPKDRWGSTPIADAIYYKNQDVIKLLEEYGAKPPIAPMHVQTVHEIPEYEIDPSELDFSNSVGITKGTYCVASWRGIQVAVKILRDDVIMDEERVRAFRDELALLQQIRHPNVVQFLGAVTQITPMMIVTEYLPKGDLRAYLKQKGALKPLLAVRFALDIARNILRDDTGHLKVADFGVSKLLKVSKTVKEDRPVPGQETSWRYVAPEVFKKEEYDTKVDVFSFALIFQEMIEGCPPFASKPEEEVPTAYCSNERPPFRPPAKRYPCGIKESISQGGPRQPRGSTSQGQSRSRGHSSPFLIHKLPGMRCFGDSFWRIKPGDDWASPTLLDSLASLLSQGERLIEQCWNEKPFKRPTFRQIIGKLEEVEKMLDHRRRLTMAFGCFGAVGRLHKSNGQSDSSGHSI